MGNPPTANDLLGGHQFPIDSKAAFTIEHFSGIQVALRGCHHITVEVLRSNPVGWSNKAADKIDILSSSPIK
jgi:hypothetical protein